jgi:hypothetical protein
VTVSPTGVDARVDAPSIARAFRVSESTVRKWAQRYPDELPRRGRDGRRTLYRWGDACALRRRLGDGAGERRT